MNCRRRFAITLAAHSSNLSVKQIISYWSLPDNDRHFLTRSPYTNLVTVVLVQQCFQSTIKTLPHIVKHY
ncbi:hypothetical protein I8752_30560 [Nostocaceae cyanobacterium CENA369]|uniref:Uncharacterized protein n=1 Tax=Dendronalium phyllosphericum CENA369 TaxID=1725256 RepID=A0A8J7IG79_9NOST|nr:hypothetical protein [Dendronalium phyllosphericum]MBH8577235.1 hypothetical protein [Dendronalium phyllosphericum CENA369]